MTELTALTIADKAPAKQRGRPWPKGVSGNPAGCRTGSRHRASILLEQMMTGDAEEVVKAVIERAKAGDACPRHEFTFLDHCIRHGDSLVGLDLDRLKALHWQPAPEHRQLDLMDRLIRDRLAKIEAERARIRDAVDGASEEELRAILARAQDQLADLKLIGDAVIAAFFSGDRPRERERGRESVRAALATGGMGWQERLRPLTAALNGEKSIRPLHWPLEFPEVFHRENPGFDAIVGNPPFAGKNNIIGATRDGYLDWLATVHEGAHGNADLVAHFYRRAFGLLRKGGCFGLLATNTIRQGDTRATGLRPIRQAGGTIYAATRRRKWPGEGAAVVVSVVHVCKGEAPRPCYLDRNPVERITAFLVEAGGDDDPQPLAENEGKSFQGSIVLGMGFTFDDSDVRGVASPLAEMHRLIAKDPHNAERIFPYIGGEEVNDSPTHAHHRYVINFEDFPLKRAALGATWAEADERKRRDWLRTGVVPADYPDPVAADWPDLLALVEEKVKPERVALPPWNNWNRTVAARWWLFGAFRKELTESIRPLDQVLVILRVSEHTSFTLLPTGMDFSERLVVIAFRSNAAFGALQSRVHEVWARFFGSTLEDRFMYASVDCFETFPFPEGFATDACLEAAGEQYYRFRADLMVQNNQGLTKTYNRFHDPDERSNAIHELRRLHEGIDRAVLDAYGWSDIPTDCDFELEWEEDEENGSGRRKKPWRYRWPEDVRDEVLARLLALNKERAAAEAEARAMRGEHR